MSLKKRLRAKFTTHWSVTIRARPVITSMCDLIRVTSTIVPEEFMSMKARLHRISATITIACIAIVAATANAQAQMQQRLSRLRAECAVVFGAAIAGKDIGHGINATGGHEQLIARLDHRGAVGIRGGIHIAVLGVEANFLSTLNSVSVKNEFGVGFPNHGERLLIYSADALLYAFRRAIREGRVRPYLTSGIGGAFFSADLDNINDQERHTRLMWNAGGGARFFVGQEPDLYLDFRFTNHRMLSAGGLPATDVRSVTVGVGYRF
jgi:opacity protein-like surface antigen